MPSVTACNIDRETAQLANIDKLGRGTYTLRYKVTTDCTSSQFMGPLSVLNGAASSSPHALPSQYATYSYGGDTDASSFAQEFTVERDPLVTKMYYVTVVFSPLDPVDIEADTGEPINNEPDPIERGRVYWWDREVKTGLVEVDRDKEPIVNKCGRMYDQTVESPQTSGVLVIEFNVRTLTQVVKLSRTYEGHTNEGPWTVGGAPVPDQTAICREVSSSPPQVENGISYFRVSMRFAFAPDGEVWAQELVERGFGCFRRGFGGPLQPIVLDARGQKKYFPTGGDPVCLDDDGLQLPDGAPPVITKWNIYPKTKFLF